MSIDEIIVRLTDPIEAGGRGLTLDQLRGMDDYQLGHLVCYPRDDKGRPLPSFPDADDGPQSDEDFFWDYWTRQGLQPYQIRAGWKRLCKERGWPESGPPEQEA